MQEEKDFIGIQQLVKNASEVIENIKRFNVDINDSFYLQKSLGRFTDWYYDKISGTFGPKKFVGFKDMTATKYEALKKDPSTNSRGNFDSSITANTLDLLSIPTQGEMGQELYIELKTFLKKYNTKPRTIVKIHIVK